MRNIVKPTSWIILCCTTFPVSSTAFATTLRSSSSSLSSLFAARSSAYHHLGRQGRSTAGAVITAATPFGTRSISKGGNYKGVQTVFRRQLSYTTGLRQMSTLGQQADKDNMDTGELSKLLRVALCQFPVTHNKEVNHETAREYISMASRNGANLVVLPEIWNSPYATAAFPKYAEVLPDIGDKAADSSPSSQLLIDAAAKYKMWIVGGSIPERTVTTDGGNDKVDQQIFNTCLVVNPNGQIVAKHRKVHLFDIDVPGGITFFESDTLSPGSTVSHFETPWGEIGLGICYDIRFAEYAQILRQKYNVCVLIYPGAFNMTTGPAHWEILQRARAVDNQCFVLTASPSRTIQQESTSDDGDTSNDDTPYPHYTAWGHSTAVSPWGDILATTDEKEGIVMADLDVQRVSEVRAGIPIGDQRRTDLYKLEHNV